MDSVIPFIPILLLVLQMGASTVGSTTNGKETCGEVDVYKNCLGVAMECIDNVRNAMIRAQKCGGVTPANCADVMKLCSKKDSGVYTIWPKANVPEEKFQVFCDMDTDGGGWTVIQRRGDYGRPEDYFFRDWESYKSGFGDITEDFWLGNDVIFALTNQKDNSIRIDLSDFQGNKRHAQYVNFTIESETGLYMLHIGGYSGDAGDAMTHNDNQSFSTKDRDHDRRSSGNCADHLKGAWWYDSCSWSNINGYYLKGRDAYRTVFWYNWKKHESLLSTEMKIRPSNFKDSN